MNEPSKLNFQLNSHVIRTISIQTSNNASSRRNEVVSWNVMPNLCPLSYIYISFLTLNVCSGQNWIASVSRVEGRPGQPLQRHGCQGSVGVFAGRYLNDHFLICANIFTRSALDTENGINHDHVRYERKSQIKSKSLPKVILASWCLVLVTAGNHGRIL